MKKKSIALVLAVALVVALAVGGTVAYLTAKTASIENTFTVGNVKISLVETKNLDENGKWQAQLIPGKTYDKDPIVSVDPTSESCYLFVKFEEVGNAANYINYTSTLTAENGWTQGDDTDIPSNVWYRVVEKDATTRNFNLLAGDKVTINGAAVTNDNMEEAAKAKLVYTAYACQYEGMTPAQAWDAVPKA